jgi:alpha-1,3-mannosyltransferase
MITSSYLPTIGGIEFHIEGLSRALTQDADITVDIAVVNIKYKKFIIDDNNENKIFQIPAKGKVPFVIFKRLTNYITNFDYDIIHIHDPQVAGLTFHFLLHNYNIPLILATHGGMFHTKSKSLLKKIYWNVITRNLITIYDRVVCVSKSDLKIFGTLVKKEKILLIENGIDFVKFNKGRINTDYKHKRFVYFGRFSKNKQVHLLIENFNRLVHDFSDIELLIIGDTDNAEYKKLLQVKSKDNDKIVISEFLEDNELLEKIKKSDFFITASNYEGFGMSVLESMSAGLIPIVNNIFPLNNLVNNGINGFVINFDDEKQALQKLKQIIRLDVMQLQTLSAQAIEKSYKFSWEIKSKNYIEIYKDLIYGKKI